jgi:beta-1,4-mannosyl-glycoprotein beta-1,4-N-acetylglucosaminyltransferase
MIYMIYDCIYFFNEINILEIRLAEIGDIVDKIILIEGSHTFSMNKKESYYLKYKDVFKKYNHKILHFIVDLTSFVDRDIKCRWEVDYYQKNYIIPILKELNIDDSDIIIISDVDEIPYKTTLSKSLMMLDDNIIFFHLTEFRSYFNYKHDNKEFIGTFMLKYDKFKKIKDTQKEIRNVYCHHRSYQDILRIIKKFNNNNIVLQHSGLHLTSFGGSRCNTYKVQSYAHHEYDNLKIKRIENCAVYSQESLINNEEYRIKSNFYKYNCTNYSSINNKDDLLKYNIDDRLFDEIKNNRIKYMNLFLFKKGI